jgi:asparagine synthase (glutamine-hydrolysing)
MSDDLQSRTDLPAPKRDVPSDLRGFARRQRYEAIHAPLQYRIAIWSERLFARHRMTYADPWADRRLIEYAVAIPQNRIFRHGQNKHLVRRALKGLMPEAARTRLQKVSPTPLYENELKDEASARIHTYFDSNGSFLNANYLQAYYGDRREGRTEEDFQFWLALCLSIWMHHHNL